MVKKVNVNAISKMDEILMFIKSKGKSVTFTEIHTGLGLPKSSVHRIITALVDLNYLIRTSEGRISFGIKLFELGNTMPPDINISNVSASVLAELVEKTNFTAHLAVFNDMYEGVYIKKIDGKDFIIRDSVVGQKIVLHASAAGKALIAWQPEKIKMQIIEKLEMERCTPNTITDKAEFLEDLALSRNRGYSIDNEERTIDIIGMGNPIIDWSGNVVGSISLGGIITQFKSERYEEVAGLLKEASNTISKLIGS